jgi:hypothetical protein
MYWSDGFANKGLILVWLCHLPVRRSVRSPSHPPHLSKSASSSIYSSATPLPLNATKIKISIKELIPFSNIEFFYFCDFCKAHHIAWRKVVFYLDVLNYSRLFWPPRDFEGSNFQIIIFSFTAWPKILYCGVYTASLNRFHLDFQHVLRLRDATHKITSQRRD